MPTHARNPPPSLGVPESKKIGFVAPSFASSEISKTINMLSKYGTTNVIEQDKNEMVQILNKMVHLKYPILEIC